MLIALIIGATSTYYILETQSLNSFFEIIYTLFLLILAFYTTILLHEVGHIIAFVWNGYKILFVAVGPIIYTNNLKKKIKVRNSIFILGGAIIPKVEKINCDAKKKQFQKAFKFSLILGPIINLVTTFICILYISILQNTSTYIFLL